MNDANVLYIFVEEDGINTVSLEDLKEWLSLVDEVVQIKIQYDASEKKNCFCVQLRHASAAEQCVYYLSNTKLKGCLIEVRSPVYKRGSTDGNSHDGAAASTTKKTKVEKDVNGKGSGAVSSHLPHNLDVPREVLLDARLVQRLPSILCSGGEGAELVERLNSLQTRLAFLMKHSIELETVANTQITTSSSVATSRTPHDGASAAPASQRAKMYQNRLPFSHETTTLSRILSYLSTHFGPLSLAIETNLKENQYLLVVQFFFPFDEERFDRAREQEIHDVEILSHEWCPIEGMWPATIWQTSTNKARAMTIMNSC